MPWHTWANQIVAWHMLRAQFRGSFCHVVADMSTHCHNKVESETADYFTWFTLFIMVDIYSELWLDESALLLRYCINCFVKLIVWTSVTSWLVKIQCHHVQMHKYRARHCPNTFGPVCPIFKEKTSFDGFWGELRDCYKSAQHFTHLESLNPSQTNWFAGYWN